MKHIRKFSTEQQYTTWKSSSNYALPNICGIGGDTIESCEPRFNDYFHFEDPEVERVIANKIGNGKGTTLAQIQACTSVEDWFKNNTTIQNFKEFKYFTGITEIGAGGLNYTTKGGNFKGCSNLKTIELPPTCTSIGISTYGPFDNCTSLLKLDLSNVTNIYYKANQGQYGAYNCTSLTKVIYNDNAKAVLGHMGCTALRMTALPSKIEKLYVNCFRGCSRITIREVPATMAQFVGKETYGGAFANCSGISYLHFLRETPPAMDSGVELSTGPFYSTSFKIYVGDGSSAEHDTEIVNAYKAATGWSLYASRIYSWYNYINS